MVVDLETYKTKAQEAIEYVFSSEYHNSLGIPMPEVQMLLADDENYSTGQQIKEGACNMDYKKAAQQVLDNIGGASNIVSAAHCATRLRLVIVDNSKVNKKELENAEGAKGVFEAQGQLQIIFGNIDEILQVLDNVCSVYWNESWFLCEYSFLQSIIKLLEKEIIVKLYEDSYSKGLRVCSYNIVVDWSM